MHKIAILGAGFIGHFYAMSLFNYRGKDKVKIVCDSLPGQAKKFAEEFGIPRWTEDMEKAVHDPEVDTVIIGIPNYLHKKAVLLAAQAGKAVLCTKPLAMNGPEALEMLRGRGKSRCLSWVSGGPGVYTQDPKGTGSHPKGSAGQGIVGALTRDAWRPSQRLVLDQGTFRWRRHRGYGLSLYRDCTQLHRQRQSAR